MTQTAQLDTFTVQAQAHVKCSVAQKATRSMEPPTRVLHQSPAELVTPTTQRLSRAKRTKVKLVESFSLLQNLIVARDIILTQHQTLVELLKSLVLISLIWHPSQRLVLSQLLQLCNETQT